MLVLLRKQWKLYPVTLALVATSAVLFLAGELYWLWSWRNAGLAWAIDTANSFGLFPELVAVSKACSGSVGLHQGFVLQQLGALGIEDFWNGDQWRLLVSAFHHATWWHIVGNLFVIYFLGSVMESYTNRWWYAAFFLASALISVLSEALHAQPAVGLSGTGYAIFGYLIVARRTNPHLFWQIPRRLVITGVASIFLCIPIGYTMNIPVAHFAHFSGFGYGLLAGWLGTSRRQPLSEASFALGHLAIVPLILLAMRPTWTDSYQDKIARTTNDNTQRVAVLEKLLATNPDNTRLRVRYVAALAQDNELDRAWRIALEGWNGTYSREQIMLKGVISDIWIHMPGPKARESGLAVMDEVFGDRSETMKDAFDLDWLSVESEERWRKIIAEAQADQKEKPAPGSLQPEVDDSDGASFGESM